MRYLVIGAAKSGTAVSKLLASNGNEVWLTDKNAIAEKEELSTLGIKVYDNGHPDILFDTNFDVIVKNPGIKYDVPLVKHFLKLGIPIINEIEVALSYAPNYRYGAITGTNGKTTITTILGELLKKGNRDSYTCGNIGLPISDIVLKEGDRDINLAIEIAAFQLIGCPSFHPVVSVCTNLSPDHLDYFESLEAYYKAKMLIYKNQREDDWFILNVDDEMLIKYAKEVPCKIITCSTEKEADLCVRDEVVYLFDTPLFVATDLKIPGKHNLKNAMMAAAMAYKMGVKPEDIKQVLSNFTGVRHRLEYVGKINGVSYYNDSKGTNPAAAKVALEAFDEVIILAGGYDKKTGFDEIMPYLNRIKKMYVYGATKDKLKAIYPEAVVCKDLKEATIRAKDEAKEGDIILLSPMCASWDQFKDYEERGDFFVDLVETFKA